MGENSQKLKIEMCLVCAELTGSFKHNLSAVTQFSQRPIYQMFETFITINLSNNDIQDRNICQNCFIKFNEIDEHQMIIEKIQSEMLQLYENSASSSMDIKAEIKMENFDFAAIDVQEEEENECADMDENPYPSESDYDYRSMERTKRKYKKRVHLDYDDYPRRKKKHSSKGSDEDPLKGFTVLEVDGRRHYKCEICHKILFRRLNMHSMTHSSERTVKCHECGALFKTLACLYTHRKIHRERKYHICDFCGMKYLQKVQLRKHFDAIHLLKKDHICSICGKCYSRDSTLQVHMLTHDGEKNVICSVCGFRTHTKSKMTRHMKSHTGERNYACEICGKRFLYSYNVIAHVNYVHKGLRYKVDESKLICKICGMKFPKQKKVKEHIAEFHNIKEEEEGQMVEEVVEWGNQI